MSDRSPNSLALLAALIVDPPPDILGAKAREIAGMALTDLVGVTLAGVLEEVSGIVSAFVGRAAGSAGQGARVAGSATRVPAPEAAFANATIGHALDFDDSSFILGGHPSVVIYPALLALAEERGLTPAAVVDAYLVGLEAMLRISAAVNLHLYEKGWHPTAALGVFGAAAGAARLLRLDAERVSHALGLAAALSSGFKASFGTMAKPIQVGHACRSGLTAALLAEAGATASEGALDAKNGFFELFNGSGNYDVAALARPSGDGVPALKFKLYPSCGATHVVIDAARALRAEHGIAAANVSRVDVRINPRRLPHVDRPMVADPLSGKFSLQYAAAVALCDGNVGVDHFTPAALARGDLRELTARVSAGVLENVEGLAQHCLMRVSLKGGDVHEIRLDGPQGRDSADYLTHMEAKFLTCAGRVLPAAKARDVYGLVRRFETLDDVDGLMARLDVNPGVARGAPRRSSEKAYV